MFRKIIVMLIVLLALPALASAWYVNAKTTPTTGQGTISPSGNTYYPAGANSGEYTVTPAPGYAVSRVTLDGVPIQPKANGKYVAPYIASKAWRYMVAYFIGSTFSITTQITAGSGAIREDTFESLTNIPVGSNRQILVLPNPGYVIASITAAGAASINNNPDGTRTVIYNNLQANQTVTASFSLVPVVTASAGSDVTANGAGAEFAITLYGSATSNQGAISYAWSGTGLSFGTPAAAITTAYAATPGTYTAILTVTSGGVVKQDSATVTVLDRTEYLEEYCTSCHSGNTPQVVSAYDASTHKARQVSCQDCHTSTPHTGVLPACVDCHTPGNSWGLLWPPAGMAFHSAHTGTNQCTSCHDTHNPGIITRMPYFPHFSNFTTSQYMTTNILCDSCHTSAVDNSFNVYSANRQWARSGKGNPKSPAYVGPGPYTEANLEAYDFKTLGTLLPAKPSNTTSNDCVRCHTTTGFINYVTPTDTQDPNTAFSNIQAWGNSSDRKREMIACNACHNDTSGFDATFSRRSIGIELSPYYPGIKGVAAWYGYSSVATKKIIRPKAYLNIANMNDSDLCIACHAGKAVGDIIKYPGICIPSAPSIACKVGTTGDFWTTVDFIDPHNLNAANLMFPDGLRAGYEYRAGISINPYHTNIGLENTQGPCVGCHMTSPKKHSFSALSTASNGTIAAISTNLCATCHGSIALPVDAGTLQTKKDGYQTALVVIAVQLAAKGIYYDAAVAPYFFTTEDQGQHNFANRTVNWNSNGGAFQGANLFGAAFNLRLLHTGGGWVHNSLYSRRILYDTIDFLDNGSQDNTVSDTIQNMPVSTTFTQEMKDKAQNYIGIRL